MEDPALKSEADTGSAEEIGGTSSLRKIIATSDAVCTVQVRPKPKYDPERRAQLAALYAQIDKDLATERDLRLGTTFDILDSSLFKGVTLSLGEFQKHVVGFWLVKPRRF